MRNKPIVLSYFILSVLLACRPGSNTPVVYHAPQPRISGYELLATQDTLRFHLPETAIGDIESWSVRQVNNETVIAFYDEFAISIAEYSYPSLKLVNVIDLSRFFKPRTIKSAYVQDYNNIYLTSKEQLLVVDSSGKIKSKFDFSTSDHKYSAEIAPESPLTTVGTKVFLALKPGVNRLSKTSLRKWEVMWSVDMQTKATNVQYYLPRIYTENFFPRKFIGYNYCVNDSGRFVFSFAADTLLYETDLAGYHHAWVAKSYLQHKPVMTVQKDDKSSAEEEWKIYMTNSYYSAIFYDKVKQRYLRLAKPEVSEENLRNKNIDHTNRIIILDKNFRIIGESDLPPKVSFRKTLFTPDGNIYSRVGSGSDDILAFIRLEYREPQKTAHNK